MKFKETLLIVCLILITLSCKKEETLQQTTLLSNENFDSGLRIYGHDFDSLIIENCTFTGKALSIGAADHVIIRNCTFNDINDHAIKVGWIGDCSNTTIENCTFKNIGYNGIDCVENAPNGIIRGCYFESTALSNIGGAMGQLHHSIYWKGVNVLIENNHFVAGKQEQSDAISLRSNGIIRGNIIQDYHTNAITYYSDHPGGDTLLIENNIMFNNGRSITITSFSNTGYNNKNIIVRFNTMVQNKFYSMYIDEPFAETTVVEIYGNIMVNESGEYFKKFIDTPIIHTNLKSTTDIGFVDMLNNDYHITPMSEAIGYCNSVANYPLNDIDGDLRIQTNLDAGADENN